MQTMLSTNASTPTTEYAASCFPSTKTNQAVYYTLTTLFVSSGRWNASIETLLT